MKHGCVLFCFFLLFSGSVSAVDFSRINVAWQYDLTAPIQLAHRVISEGGELNLFLQVRTDTIDWKYSFSYQDGYESEKDVEISPSRIDTLESSSVSDLLSIKIGSVPGDLLVIKISPAENLRAEESYFYDIPLKIGSIPLPSIYPVNAAGLPILANYINRSGYQWENSSYFVAMQYRESYSAADPPMADMKPLAPSLSMDSSFTFTDSVSFQDGYFYTVLHDSSAASGVTMLKVPPYFPEYRQLRELVESMFYITSDLEKKTLMNSKDLKKNFDSFWINNFSTKTRARNAIRKYYKSVERANILFTDFKAGWKTDRGMMFIVFGLPDEVYRTNGLEEWYYDSGEAFEFSVISSFFAARTYTLRRKIDFETLWFQKVSGIRKGINE